MAAMRHCLSLVFAKLLVTGTQAYAPGSMPIKWVDSHRNERILVPKGSVSSFRGLAPRTLTLMDPLDTISLHMIPRFLVNLDESIVLDDMGWCIEGDQIKNTVRINRCTGGQDQKFYFIPEGKGEYRIQLKDANACLGVTDREAVELQKCDRQETHFWTYGEVGPVATQSPSHNYIRSPTMRHGMILLVALVGIALLTLRQRFQQRPIAVNRETLGLGYVPADTIRRNGVAMTAPSDEYGSTPSPVLMQQITSVPASLRNQVESKFSDPKLKWQGGGGGGSGGSGGGGGGNGGSGGGGGVPPDNVFMREITGEEGTIIFDDWTSKSMVYRMTGTMGGDESIGQMHNKQVERLEKLREFNKTPYLLAALFENAPELVAGEVTDAEQTSKIRGIVGAEVADWIGHKKLVVRHLAFYPSVLNSPDASQRLLAMIMLHLVQMAQTMQAELDVTPLTQDPYYQGGGLSSE